MTMRKRKIVLEVVLILIDVASVAYTKRKKRKGGNDDWFKTGRLLRAA